jgi:AraC family transcriptional regulator
MSMNHVVLSDAGKFEVRCDPASLVSVTEAMCGAVHICIPMKNALYSVTRRSDTGKVMTHKLGARDVLVMPSNQSDVVTWRKEADFVSFRLSEAYIRRATGASDLEIRAPLTIRDPFVSSVAAKLRALTANGKPPSSAFIEAIATLIAFRVGEEAAAGQGMRTERAVKSLSRCEIDLIVHYIDQHLDCSISVSALADLLDMSKSHFMKRFTASHGVPPHAFITQRRLDRAKHLLADSGMSITDIAIEVGMTLSHFSRSFLQRFGKSPREFRQMEHALR